MSEKVSVIIPSYNRFAYLMNTIQSVRSQTYTNLEIIVVNDRSTEPEYYTHDWQDIRIIHLDQNSKELFGHACPGGFQRNYGMEVATGKYIAFCDDDDMWFPQKLELQILAMEETGCSMSSTDGLIGQGMYNSSDTYRKYNAEHYYSELQQIYRGVKLFPRIWKRAFLEIHNSIICSSVVLTAELAKRTGRFAILKRADDYEYWLRALQHTDLVYVDDVCFYYDNGHGNGQNY